MKILLIEDDEILAQQLKDHLTAENYGVEAVPDGNLGLEYAQGATYDLILLDVHLPQGDGLAICRRLRQRGYEGAILLQTVESGSDYKVAGLDAGADDYIVKPYPLEELSARLRALLRRPRKIVSPVLQWGVLQLNPRAFEVSYGEQPIALSPKEFNLLELFLRNPQRVFNSATLLERVWGFDETPGEETVRTHIKRLRQKLRRAGATAVIENIYGMGYRLKAEEEDTASPPAREGASDQARQAAKAAIGQFQDILLKRLTLLEQAAAAPTLDQALRHQARQAAHKLAGSLGMFGLVAGSDYSRQAEEILKGADPSVDQGRLRHLVAQIFQELGDILPVDSRADLGAAPGIAPLTPPQPEPKPGPSQEPAHMLGVSADAEWINGLQNVVPRDLALLVVKTLASAQRHILNHSPTVVLIDVASVVPPGESLRVLIPLLKTCARLPVIIATGTDSFDERRQIARYCSCSFLPRDHGFSEILAAVQATLKGRCSENLRVLAVDDDPLVLNALARQLPAWGIQVTPLEDPRQLWQYLLTLQPDVLILDVEMPHIGGIELCQVIRSDSRWSGLPILFLSGRRDAETIQSLYSAGADDYIPKPFTEPELVTRIMNRWQRTHHRQQSQSLHLPGSLLVPQQAIQDLKRGLLLAQQYQQCYCLGLISWGVDPEPSSPPEMTAHAQALNRLVSIVKRNLRREDVITQFSPATLTVGLYGITAQAAQTRFDHVLDQLNEATASECEPHEAVVTFRYRFAIAPQNGTTLAELRQVAEPDPCQANPEE